MRPGVLARAWGDRGNEVPGAATDSKIKDSRVLDY